MLKRLWKSVLKLRYHFAAILIVLSLTLYYCTFWTRHSDSNNNSNNKKTSKSNVPNVHRLYIQESTYNNVRSLVSPNLELYPKRWSILDMELQYLINNDICAIPFPQGQIDRKEKASHGKYNEENTNGNDNNGSGEPGSGTTNEVLLLIFIPSYVGNFEVRQKIRESLPVSEMASLGIRRLFLLAMPKIDLRRADPSMMTMTKSDKIVLDKVLKENEENLDLVLVDFMEEYRHLTYKTLAGLQWVPRYCPHAQYVLKVDDDNLVDVYKLVKILNQAKAAADKVKSAKITNTKYKHDNNNPVESSNNKNNNNYKVENKKKSRVIRVNSEQEIVIELEAKLLSTVDKRFVMGQVHEKAAVCRYWSKWSVTKEEFEADIYPNYVKGLSYLTNVESIRDIMDASKKVTKYFWLEDVFVMGTLAGEVAHIDMINIEDFVTKETDLVTCCLTPSHLNLIEGSSASNSTWTVPAKNEGETRFWCDYLMGTSDGDLEIYSSFYKLSRYCYRTNSCKVRGQGERLSDTCTISRLRLFLYSLCLVLVFFVVALYLMSFRRSKRVRL